MVLDLIIKGDIIVISNIGGDSMKILNFLLRMVYGAVGIQVVNLILSAVGISVSVGLNLVSLLTVGTLGVSGLGLLFGISAYGVL